MPNSRAAGRSQIQSGALAVAGFFALIGVAGFIPGITDQYDLLRFATADSRAYLFGVFQVSVLHNLIHIATAVAGFIGARRALWSRNYLFTAGVCYMLLFFYGVTIRLATDINVIPMNDADNAFNIIVGLVMIALSILLDRGAGRRETVGAIVD